MRSIGGLLFLLGAGSVVLNLMGREFLVLAPLTPYQPTAGIVVALIGAALIAFAEYRERSAPAPFSGAPEPPTPGPPMAPDRDAEPSADLDRSSPVPLGPASEPAASPGTGTSAPAPVTPASQPPDGRTTPSEIDRPRDDTGPA